MSKDNKTFVRLRDAGTVFFDMTNQTKVAGDQIVEVVKEGKVATAIKDGILVEVPADEAKKLLASASEKNQVAEDLKSDTTKLKAEHEAEIKDLKAEHEKELKAKDEAHAEALKTANDTIEALKAEIADLKKPADAGEAVKEAPKNAPKK